MIPEFKLPMNEHRKLARSAERGASLLDKKAGKWWNRIRTGRLEMSSSCNCIYGQLQKEDILAQIASQDIKATRFSGFRFGIHNANDHFGYTPNDSAFTAAMNFADRTHEAQRAAGADWPSEDWNTWHTIKDAADNIVWNILQEEWLRQIKIRRDAEKAAA